VLTALVLMAAGAVLLVAGSEAFAEHIGPAARVARVSAFGLAALVAGAEPEEAWTAAVAAWRDRPGLAIGDAIGANLVIATVTIGLLAVVAPLAVTPTVRRYAMVSGGAAVLALLALLGERVGRAEGVGLVVVYLVLVGLLWRAERRPPSIGELGEAAEADDHEAGDDAESGWRPFGLVGAGLAAMVVGGIVVVEGAERLVSASDRDDSAIGLTVLALATSAEMLALVWSARRRGVPEIALAATLGAVAYNATVSLGVAAIVRPLRVDDKTATLVVAVAVVVALAGLVAHRRRVARPTGALLIATYAALVAWLLV
jgi:cation:H+ antiporter